MSTEQRVIISGSVFDAAHTTAKNKLGMKVEFDDGRVFRYVSTALNFVAGEVVGAPAASAVTANVMVAAAIGAKTVYGVLAGTTANKYAEGYLFITDDTGQGYTYRIKGNTAAATVGGVANTVIFTMYDGLLVAIDTSSDFVVIPNIYSLVLEGATTVVPLGVCCAPTTAATDGVTQYVWIQTKGVGVALVTTNTTIDKGLEVASGASGGVVIKTANIALLGVALSATEDAGGFLPVLLKCE